MKIKKLLELIYKTIQDFFSFLTGGSECIGCGANCYALPLCNSCQKLLTNFVPFNNSLQREFLLQARCKRCGKILICEDDLCFECRESKETNSAIAYFPLHSYRLWKKDLMYCWKTENVRPLSLFFADLVYSAICSLKENKNLIFDSIIPVPPRPGKIKEKGWDQIDELCKILYRKYNCKIQYPLERLTSFEQKKLSKEQRKNSSGTIYSLKENAVLNGKRFLLLDDVITTGATMEKCALLLKKLGAKEVYGLSLFIVD